MQHQGLIFSLPSSVSKLQGQHFGGPSFAFPFRGTSGQFWEQLSCAWKMSSAFGNYTFLLMPGVLRWATSMVDCWEDVQLGHHKWSLGAPSACPWGGKAVLIASSGKIRRSSLSLPGPPIDHLARPSPCGSCFILFIFIPASCDCDLWVNQSLHFFSLLLWKFSNIQKSWKNSTT